MKKKVAATILAAAMCAGSLTGCSGGSNGVDSAEGGKLYRVGFVNLADSDANCFECESVFKEIVESDDFQSKIGSDSKVEVLVADSDSDIEKQTTNVETMLAQGIDALFLIGVDTEGNSTAVQACNQENVPVFMVATEATEGEYKFIGFDEIALGKQQGEWCAANLPENANICYLSGTPGREAAVMREQGFMEGIKSRSDLTILGNQSADFMTEDAMQVTEDWIQAHGDKINCIVAQDNKMTAGAVEALKAANMMEKVTVVGVITPGTWDAEMIKNKEMTMAVYVGFKTLGELCADVCSSFYSGQDIPEINHMQMFDITEENYSEYFS